MNTDVAKLILQDVHAVLNEIGLTHFLIDGTLLGAVREGDFIAHDTDIDLGVLFEEWEARTVFDLTHRLNQKRLVLNHQFGDFDHHFELSFHRDGIKIDLFFYRRDGEYRIFHAFKNGARHMPTDLITYEYPAALIENLKPLAFHGESYPAPTDPVAVLECKYGPNWRTPVTDWDWQYGPRNVRK
jgi:hypothetical protein